jgi:phosphopantetheinyl transferase
MKTMVYIFDTKVLEDKKLFSKLYKTVPEYRQKKVDSYVTDADKRACLGTGVVFSHAIQEAGLVEDDLKLAYGENGRPFFENNTDFHFCLSHSGDRAMCAVSDEPIGCDVELISSEKDTDLWTRLESYAKATDIPLFQLMNQKSPFSADWIFKETDLGDGYKYMICTQEDLADDQITVYKLD